MRLTVNLTKEDIKKLVLENVYKEYAVNYSSSYMAKRTEFEWTADGGATIIVRDKNEKEQIESMNPVFGNIFNYNPDEGKT